MIAECAALVSEVPTFMLPIWATKRRVTTSSGRTSERRSRKPAKRPVTHAQSMITTPPTTKRIHARRNGGASSSPSLIATGLPPQKSDSRSASSAADRSRSRRSVTGAPL